jgi:nucleoside-diphosphate-sugar epimerase
LGINIMLILIAGVTGNIGQHAARYALSQNHEVRGLGRTPEKLDVSIRNKLESFVQSKAYYDIPALDVACKSVDAIICAYSGTPEMHLDAQLLLLRAAERAGVKIFLAAGWNYDWRKIQFGIDEPIYDAIMSFHRQVATSSSIKPCHIFSGMLAEVFFGTNGQDGFTPKDDGVWEAHAAPGEKSMDVWGTGDSMWNFTTEEDAGILGVEVVTRRGAEQGGFINVCSWTCSLNDIRKTYEQLRSTPVKVNQRGSVEDLEKLAIEQRSLMGPSRMWEWHRYWFHLFCVKGTWNLDKLQNNEFPKFTATTLEEFLQTHPEI